MKHRRTVNTPFGAYTEIIDDTSSAKDGAAFLEYLMYSNDDRSLYSRINKNHKELVRLSKSEDLSLEEVVSVFHSLIHKVTEGISTGDEKEAKRAYSIIQETLPKFNLPE
jgi:hypothetical protein